LKIILIIIRYMFILEISLMVKLDLYIIIHEMKKKKYDLQDIWWLREL
jgi:hypothetical protein